jgi:hypothetical protein
VKGCCAVRPEINLTVLALTLTSLRSRIPTVAPVSRPLTSPANQASSWLQMSKQNAGRSILILQARRCRAELPKGEVRTREIPATSDG